MKSYRQDKRIVISTKDHGIGMDETTRPKSFANFFTTKQVGEGTSLGLSIALGIINEHNGRVEVITALGQGTEFLIYLPTTTEKCVVP